MDKVQKLLEQAQLRVNARSGAELGRALGVTRSAVHLWHIGRSYPDEVACSRLAQILELPLAQVLGIVGEARAKGSAAKAVWRRLAQGAAGALIIGAATLLPATPANAAQRGTWADSPPVYIMSLRL